MSAATSNPVAQPGRVVGYVEVIERGRVFGWAWEPGAPSQRLEIELRCEDRVLATGVAEKMRADLAQSKIGDGAHAFDISIPADNGEVKPEEIRVFARNSAGESVPLVRRGAPGPTGKPEDPATLRRIADALSMLGAAQQKFVHSTQKKLAVIETAAGSDGSEKAVAALEPVVVELRAAQDKLEQRMGELDVFLVRFDSTLRDLDEKIAALQRDRRLAYQRSWAVAAGILAVLAIGASVAALIY